MHDPATIRHELEQIEQAAAGEITEEEKNRAEQEVINRMITPDRSAVPEQRPPTTASVAVAGPEGSPGGGESAGGAISGCHFRCGRGSTAAPVAITTVRRRGLRTDSPPAPPSPRVRPPSAGGQKRSQAPGGMRPGVERPRRRGIEIVIRRLRPAALRPVVAVLAAHRPIVDPDHPAPTVAAPAEPTSRQLPFHGSSSPCAPCPRAPTVRGRRRPRPVGRRVSIDTAPPLPTGAPGPCTATGSAAAAEQDGVCSSSGAACPGDRHRDGRRRPPWTRRSRSGAASFATPTDGHAETTTVSGTIVLTSGI